MASTCTIHCNQIGSPVAAICRGQQVEEFNHQIEGGLYAQLISNPSFEDERNLLDGWSLVSQGTSHGTLTRTDLRECELVNEKQRHCGCLKITSTSSGPVGIANQGYGGVMIGPGKQYRITLWCRKSADFNGSIFVSIEDSNGAKIVESQKQQPLLKWSKFEFVLETPATTVGGHENRIAIYATQKGTVYFDVVTAMPPTWKNRENGCRIDIAEKMADLKLKYLQFPGGCTAESAGMNSCWSWKDTVGPLEERRAPTRDRWKYRNDGFFGLDDFFHLAEDLGAEPVYVTSVGISESPGSEYFGICPIEKMPELINDVLDLIEYCNGDSSTTWGRMRARNGHPSPYNLTQIEVGNENGMWTTREYVPRYKLIRDSIILRYPNMRVLCNGFGDNQGLSEGLDESEAIIDEHYYGRSLVEKYHIFDKPIVSLQKRCVAEFASSCNGNGGNVLGNWSDALSDAVFSLGCERNSGKIFWTGYGNFSGTVGHGDFGPCLIWSDASRSFATPTYYGQKLLFSDHIGDFTVPFTNNSSISYVSVVRESNDKEGNLLIKLVNPTEKTDEICFILEGLSAQPRISSVQRLSGRPDSENSFDCPFSLRREDRTIQTDGKFTYRLAPFSMALIICPVADVDSSMRTRESSL